MPTYKGFTPFDAQKKVITSIINSKKLYNVLKVGRRFGKTLIGENLMLYWAINHGPANVLWVSPTHSQAKKVMNEVCKAIKNTGIIQVFNQTDRYIELVNGSTMWFSGVDKQDSIRGSGYHYVICDEMAFWKKGTFETVIRPLLLVGGRKCLIISTPKGRNDFHKVFHQGLEENTNYASFSANIFDSPLINVNEIEDARKTLPEFIFNQEYLAEFLDNDFAVFKNFDKIFTLAKYKDYTPGEYFAGLDLARKNDFTSLVVLDKTGECVHIYRDNLKSWESITKNIVAVLKKYQPHCLVEVNNIGDVIFELLQKEYRNKLYPFYTDNTSKNNMIENLIVKFETTAVRLPNQQLYQPFRSEFETFGYEYNPNTRTVKYKGEEGCHDDIVISTALASECFNRYKTAGKVPIKF